MLVIFLLSLFFLIFGFAKSECNTNYIPFDIASQDKRARSEDKRELIPGYNIAYNLSGLKKFIARGLEYGRDYATSIVIKKISGDINLTLFTLHYSIEDLQLDDFIVPEFTITLPSEDNGTAPTIDVSNAEIYISAYISWKTSSWPPIGETYIADFKIRNLSLFIDMIFNDRSDETDTKYCPYHVKLTTENSYINLGKVSITLTKTDGTVSPISALLDLIVPSLVDILQEELGPVLISTIFSFLEGIFNTKTIITGTGYDDSKITGINPNNINDDNYTPYLAQDIRSASIKAVPTGIRLDFAGYYITTKDYLTKANATGSDSIEDYYYDPNIDTELVGDDYSVFPNVISSADFAFSWSYFTVNSLFYHSYKHTSFFNPNKVFSEELLDDSETELREMLFGNSEKSLILQYLRSFGEQIDQAKVDEFEIGNEKVTYKINSNNLMIPFIKTAGASGLLLEGEGTIEILIGDETILSTNKIMDFVLKPTNTFIPIILPDGSYTNTTSIFFDYIPYSLKSSTYRLLFNNESKLLNASSINLKSNKWKTLSDLKNNLSIMPNNLKSSDKNSTTEAFIIALLQKFAISRYFIKYSKLADFSLFVDNVPLYNPEKDGSYFTFNRNYFSWNINVDQYN